MKGGLNDKKVDYGLEDYDSVVNMMSKGLNGIVLPELLFYYRIRSGSMFRNITTQKLLYSNSYIATKYKNYYTNFALQIINLLNANGPGYLYDNPTLEVQISISVKKENILIFKIKNLVRKNEGLKKLALLLKSK